MTYLHPLAPLKKRVRAVLPDWMWMRLKRLYYGYALPRYQPRTVRRTYGGVSLDVFLADPIAEGWYDWDMDERPEISLLKRSRLKPGALVFNLGAHQCVIAMTLAHAVRPGGRLVALEPSPQAARVGEVNCRANGYQEIEILNAAVAQSSGTVMFTPDLRVAWAHEKWPTFEVTSYSIDDLARQFGTPDVIYMDVEGYECLALAGAPKTLRQNVDWFVEVHAGRQLERFGGSAQSVLQFFPRENYEIYVWPEDESTPVRLNVRDRCPRRRFFLVGLHT